MVDPSDAHAMVHHSAPILRATRRVNTFYRGAFVTIVTNKGPIKFSLLDLHQGNPGAFYPDSVWVECKSYAAWTSNIFKHVHSVADQAVEAAVARDLKRAIKRLNQDIQNETTAAKALVELGAFEVRAGPLDKSVFQVLLRVANAPHHAPTFSPMES